jgi:hypothetical protein
VSLLCFYGWFCLCRFRLFLAAVVFPFVAVDANLWFDGLAIICFLFAVAILWDSLTAVLLRSIWFNTPQLAAVQRTIILEG